nr:MULTISPECIES: prepilin peptidase [unclassified Xanthobacter]
MASICIEDLRQMIIRDRSVLWVIALFVPFAALHGYPFERIVYHLVTGLVFFAVLFIAAVWAPLGPLGGGDAKIMGALGIWFGVGSSASIDFLVLACLIGGAFTLAAYAFRFFAGVLPVQTRVPLPWLENLLFGPTPVMRVSVPFGVPLAIAGGVTVWSL